MKQSLLYILVLLSVFGISCEKNTLGIIDVTTDTPLLSNASVSPDSIFIDNLTPTGNLYGISSIVSVRIQNGKRIELLTATVFRPNSTIEVVSISLRDDGASPDQIANDSVFSGKVDFAIQRSSAGRYRIQFSSKTVDGLFSNTIENSLNLTRRNSAPKLVSVATPDSIQLPALDTIRVQFTAVASDSDGLADIREVFFRRIDPPDPTKFFMKDDGSLDPPVFIGGPGGIPVRSGDNIAGDGNYSFLIPVLPTSTRRTNIFEFQCVDSFGDTSGTILRSFTIR